MATPKQKINPALYKLVAIANEISTKPQYSLDIYERDVIKFLRKTTEKSPTVFNDKLAQPFLRPAKLIEARPGYNPMLGEAPQEPSLGERGVLAIARLSENPEGIHRLFYCEFCREFLIGPRSGTQKCSKKSCQAAYLKKWNASLK